MKIAESTVIFLLSTGFVVAQYEDRENIPVYIPGSEPLCTHAPEPKITVTPDPFYYFDLCQSAYILCEATGIPTPYVYWIKGKKDLTGKEERLPVTAVGKAILYFDKIQEDDIDYYTCVVEDCCRGKKITTQTEIRLSSEHSCNKNDKANAFYNIVWRFMSWHDAKKYCDDRNSKLAAPKTEKDNSEVYKAIVDSVGTDPDSKKFAHHNMLWIGMNDFVDEGVFRYAYGGNNVTYFNWLLSQPDNWRRYDEGGQDVVAIDRNSGYWDDSYSFWKRPFVCYCPPIEERNY